MKRILCKNSKHKVDLKELPYHCAVWLTVLTVSLYGVSTLLYNMPEGYGKDRIDKTGYFMDPLFSQNWSLFAPEAPLTDVGFLARIRIDGNANQYQDISSPALNEQRGRIIPDRRYRLLSGAFVGYVQAEEALYNAARGEETYPGVFLVSSTELSSIIAAPYPTYGQEIDEYRSMQKIFTSVIVSFVAGETPSSHLSCGTERSVQVRVIGVPISGMTVRNDEVTTRDLPWASC